MLELFCGTWLLHGWQCSVGCLCLQLSRGVLGSWWDVHPYTHVPVHPCAQGAVAARASATAALLAASPLAAGATVVV